MSRFPAFRLDPPFCIGEMVRDHYPKLGFTLAEVHDDGSSRSVLDLPTFVPASTFIEVTEG